MVTAMVRERCYRSSDGEHGEQSAVLALCQSSDRGSDNTTSTTCVTPWLGLCGRERVNTSEI